jgi:hypothetical protein
MTGKQEISGALGGEAVQRCDKSLFPNRLHGFAEKLTFRIGAWLQRYRKLFKSEAG